MKKVLIVGGIALSLFSCSVTQGENTRDLVNATAWTQNAGEFQALTLQAYHLAKIRLDDILESDQTDQPKAIVLDIDETVLDNSPYEAYQIVQNKAFSQEDWGKWTSLAAAKPLAGAIDFLNYTHSKGVEIFYVSNRMEAEREPTLKNLQNTGFPAADHDHLILKTDVSSKESRRQNLAKKYNIVLFFGDNLSDFSDIYYYNAEGKSATEMVMENSKLFGTKYIVLPNAMYGDWESSMYKKNKNKKLSNKEVKIRSLKPFVPKNNN